MKLWCSDYSTLFQSEDVQAIGCRGIGRAQHKPFVRHDQDDELKGEGLGGELTEARWKTRELICSTMADGATSSLTLNITTCSMIGRGDDPRDVKAWLKVWVQAIALVSASKYSS
ncbi:hypothetical protein E2542_SST14262 [Spatholobus suberectus]|nr:hypothetical protein E2542_SST14262 [Spatholobus suberectus]